ncbi:Tryptophan 2-monooxygenase [Fusarium oxysporum f. sp. albedinis]|nr:Tryptophan 2-monooxygenase [Fusarium oxysporum f. sp. albedinis]
MTTQTAASPVNWGGLFGRFPLILCSSPSQHSSLRLCAGPDTLINQGLAGKGLSCHEAIPGNWETQMARPASTCDSFAPPGRRFDLITNIAISNEFKTNWNSVKVDDASGNI